MDTKDRVRALREALGLTQAELSRQTGGELDASYVYKLETGRNKASSHKVRTALATAFGLSLGDLDDYLAGRLSLEQALERGARGRGEPRREHREPVPPPVAADESDESPLEAALLHALDKSRHTIRDVDAVRAALRETHFLLHEDGDLVGAARTWLDAAAQLRHEGVTVTPAALLVRVTVGRGMRAQAVADEIDATTAAADAAAARARGYEPGAKRHVGERLAARVAKKRRGPDDGE